MAAAAVIVLVAGAQLVPVARTNPAVRRDIAAPPEIDALWRRACHDCHSRGTAWPWYGRGAPISWLVVHDVEEGGVSSTSPRGMRTALRSAQRSFVGVPMRSRKGEMPPWHYRLVHADARLTATERESLRAWCLAEIARLGG